MLYCKVENNTPQPPAPLPQVINGTVSNVAGLPDSELAIWGFYPFIQTIQPDCNPATHRVVQELQFTGTQVNQVWAVVALTADERMAYLRAIRVVFKGYLNQHMDAEVACRDYDNIVSACSWKDSQDQAWAAESMEADRFREACYKVSYAIENAVLAGTRPIPTREQFLSDLPSLGWCPVTGGGGNSNGTLQV